MTRKNQEETQPELDIFVKRILFCLGEQRLLKSDVQDAYLKRFPPIFSFRNKPLLSLRESKVEAALKQLISFSLIKREVTRWHDGQELKEDTSVYLITEKGRLFLSSRKK